METTYAKIEEIRSQFGAKIETITSEDVQAEIDNSPADNIEIEKTGEVSTA